MKKEEEFQFVVDGIMFPQSRGILGNVDSKSRFLFYYVRVPWEGLRGGFTVFNLFSLVALFAKVNCIQKDLNSFFFSSSSSINP